NRLYFYVHLKFKTYSTQMWFPRFIFNNIYVRSISMNFDKDNHEQLSLFDLLEESANHQYPNEKTDDLEALWPKFLGRNSFPNQLIHDFNQFMNYLDYHFIQLTNKMGYISQKHLPHINEQLSIKSE